MAEAVIPRFKVEVKVVDESGCVVLILFDREVSQVLMCSASELVEGLVAVCIFL